MKPLIACILFVASASIWKAKEVKEEVVLSDREKVMQVASSQIGIREKTGRNDGEVEKYIAFVGLDPKAHLPYCVAFISWCGDQALGEKSPYPKSAWSPTHLSGGERLTTSTNVKPAGVFGIYDRRRKRVSHGGFTLAKTGNYIITVEANTSNKAAIGSEEDRDASKGGGVYKKRRRIGTSLRYKEWIVK